MRENSLGEFKKFFMFFVLSTILILLDQWSKRLALIHLKAYEAHPLIPGVLELLRIENTGAAFGILKGHMTFFYGITAIVGVFILFVLFKTPPHKKYFFFLVSLSFILSGAIGNLSDRIFRKSVVDFIYFVPIDFPVFNIADIFVTCGTALLMVLILFYYKDEDFCFLTLWKKHAV